MNWLHRIFGRKALLMSGLMVLSFGLPLRAAWLDNVPVTVVQPNGDTLHIFATGDEFYHYMHDADGYTIVQDPETGYYVYADKVGDNLVATQLVVGLSTPTRAIRQPRLTISNEEYRRRRLEMEGPNPPSLSLSKNTSGEPIQINHIVIFITFADEPIITNEYDEVDFMFNSEETGARSVYNYYKTVSYDQVHITSSYYPFDNSTPNQFYSYPCPLLKCYYQPYSITNLVGYRNSAERREREIQLLEAAINYVNGSENPIPESLNIDYNNDNLVDIITFAVNASEDDWSDLFWPHMWSFDETTQVRINGKKPHVFTFELLKSNRFYLNTFCHELNHAFGSPDFYRACKVAGPSPLEKWDIMCTSMDDNYQGVRTANPSSYIKWKYLKWIEEIPLVTESGDYTIYSLGAHSTQNAFRIASSVPNQYYILECRNQNELFDENIYGSGMLIYRVNEEIDAGLGGGNIYAYPEFGIYDELYLFRPSEIGIQYAALIQGQKFNLNTDPYPCLSDGTLDDLNIKVVSASEGSVTFRYTENHPAPKGFSVKVDGLNLSMSWTECTGATSYTLYEDKTPYATVYGTSYSPTNIPALYGTHKYYVRADYPSGQSHTSNVEKITIKYPGPEITGFNAEKEDENVVMSWTDLPSHTDHFRHFTETTPTGFKKCALPTTTKCIWFERFPSIELSRKPGKAIMSVDIWVAPEAINKEHTISFCSSSYVYDLDTLDIEPIVYTPTSSGWNHIWVEDNHSIDIERDLLVFVTIADNDNEYAAYRTQVAYTTESFIYENEENANNENKTFTNYKKLDPDDHWLISLGIEDPEYTYNVYRKNLQTGIVDTLARDLVEPGYTDADVPVGVYNYYITANLFEGESAPSEMKRVVISTPPQGATPGIFSVGYNKYAYFSQGNLQYRASTNTWRFAEHQWDFVGGEDWDGNVLGNVYETDDQGQQFKCDNGWISETYNGWIDLFGWGTSGIPHGANCYQPWSTSYDNEDYYAYGQAGRSLYEKNEEDEGALADWGYNAISNGGNQLNSGWRTPTAAEWDYLMNTRHTASGIRYAFAVVNDVNGMILLPDDWDPSVYPLNNPNYCMFSFYGRNDNGSLENYFDALYDSNNIDGNTWTDTFEPTGAVFIPFSPTRYGTIYSYWDWGCLWSSSSDSQDPLAVWEGVGAVISDVGSFGCAVRLVRDVIPIYMVTASSRQGIGGTVSGEDSYGFGEICTLEAVADEGYEFAHWTENGVVVSTEPTYSFGVYTNHWLEAHFRNMEEEDPDLLEGLFTVGEDRVARFAKGNLNLDFQFHAGSSPDVDWHFAEHQYDCKEFDINAFNDDPVGYMEENGMDLIYQRFLNDINNNDVVLDLGCWRNLSIEEWEYLLFERVTACGMHYTLGRINNVPGFIIFPDDWDAANYPIPYNTIDGDVTQNVVYNEISVEDWEASFEPHHAVFLPLCFKSVCTNDLNNGITQANWGLNYSVFSCEEGYYDSNNVFHIDNSIMPVDYTIPQPSRDGYSWKLLFFGYERPVQVESKKYEIIGAQPNPLWAGEVNGGGIFENQMRDGDTCTLTATAKSGHTFLGWYEQGGLVSTDTILAFVVEGSRFIEARYSADAEYQVYVESLPWDGGYADGGGQFEEWQECQLEAGPNEHYHFVGWMENDSIVSTATTLTITVTSERHLQACFAENQSFNLTVNAVPEVGGNVFPSMESMYPGHGPYYAEIYEETVTASIMAAANDGYHFVGWKVGDEWVSMDEFYNFTFPSNDLALEAHFELCEVESEPDPDLLSGRFSISDCTTVGFAKGNVIGYFEQNYETMTSSWEFAPGQYYRQYYSEGNMNDDELSSLLKNGMDLVNNTMVHVGIIDFDCWHLLTSEEWNYLLKERDMEIRYAFAKVNNVEGMLVMPDDWNPSTYSINSPNENVPYATNSISRYDWNTFLEPAGVLFLPANGAIMSIYQNHQNYIESMYHQGENAIGFYPNMVFMPDMLGVITEEFASEMPMLYSSMRLAQIVEADSSNVELSVEASQTDFGMVSGGGEFNCGSSCTVTATPNNGYVFRYWLEEDEVVSTVAEYTFPVTADRNLVAVFAEETEMCEVEIRLLYNESSAREGWRGDAVVLNFGNNQPEVRFTLPVPQIDWYEIYLDHGNTSVNFEELGLPEYLSYPMYVNKDDTITVSYEQSGLSSMYGSEPECIFVLAFADADTIVEGSAAEVLPFTFVGNCDLFASHTKALDNGWNWWSTYIEQEGVDGLSILERSLGYDGNMIKSRSDGYVESYEYEGTIGWFGPLTSIKNEQMYKIDMNTDGKAVMRGLRTETSSHPITINFGWNWIGLPLSQPVAVSQAMSGFSPEVDDVIKGRNGFATYYSSDGVLGWYGTLNILEPGSGYMYQSHANGIKTLVFQEGRGGALVANITPEGNVYRPNGGRYADNMTVTAVVEVNGEELRSDAYELAAFASDECRGSVRLMYVEPVDRYVAFLTVFGEQGDDIGFRLSDGAKTLQSPDHIGFVADGVSGSLADPSVLRFGDTGIEETSTMVRIHPNPVDRDARFTISLPLDEDIEEVVITDALGAIVRHETGALKATMEGLSTSGVYMVKATCRSGNVYIGRLIVK